MTRLVFGLGVAATLAVGIALGCVDVGWKEGIRCADQSCPAGFTCCGGQCYVSCPGTSTGGGASSGTPKPVDAAADAAGATAGTRSGGFFGAGGIGGGGFRSPVAGAGGFGFGFGPFPRRY